MAAKSSPRLRACTVVKLNWSGKKSADSRELSTQQVADRWYFTTLSSRFITIATAMPCKDDMATVATRNHWIIGEMVSAGEKEPF